MSRNSHNQKGFTLPEMMVTVALIGIISTTVYASFNTAFIRYFGLQKEGTNFTELASQSHRIANVIRGATDILSAANNDLTIYGYFSPTDTYVSQIHYYKNSANTILYADVTQMTENPPIGTPITSTKKTYTIIENFYQVSGSKLFVFLDASGNEITTPIADLHTIKGIQINLSVPTSNGNVGQSMSLQVSLRNRKTNL